MKWYKTLVCKMIVRHNQIEIWFKRKTAVEIAY